MHGRPLSSLDRHDILFTQSRTTIIAQHRAYASVEVKPDCYTTLFLSLCRFYLISKTSYSTISQIQMSQRAILRPTGFLLPTGCEEVTDDW